MTRQTPRYDHPKTRTHGHAKRWARTRSTLMFLSCLHGHSGGGGGGESNGRKYNANNASVLSSMVTVIQINKMVRENCGRCDRCERRDNGSSVISLVSCRGSTNLACECFATHDRMEPILEVLVDGVILHE